MAKAEKKGKAEIAKAATQKKGGVKKWTKGKAKEKAEHAVFVDKATYDRVLLGIPKLGKFISTSAVIDKFKVVGSVARALLKKALENGSLARVEAHSKQTIYTPILQVETKAAVTEAAPAQKGKGAKKGK